MSQTCHYDNREDITAHTHTHTHTHTLSLSLSLSLSHTHTVTRWFPLHAVCFWAHWQIFVRWKRQKILIYKVMFFQCSTETFHHPIRVTQSRSRDLWMSLEDCSFSFFRLFTHISLKHASHSRHTIKTHTHTHWAKPLNSPAKWNILSKLQL